MPEARKVEIHVTLNPTPLTFNQLHYLAASLRLNGGPLAESKIIVTLGGESEPFDPHARLKWSKKYNLEWRWVPHSFYAEHGNEAPSLYRFRYDYEAPLVVLMAPRMLVTAPFDDLLAEVQRDQKVMGVPANFSPMARVGHGFTWEGLFDLAGLGAVPYVMEHSGYGLIYDDADHRLSPPYFNLGMLALPATLAHTIGDSVFGELDYVAQAEDRFRAQMSVTLAMVRHQMPFGVMAFRYNFVNNEVYLQRYRADFEDVRLLQYLDGQGSGIGMSDFESPATVEALLAKEYALEVDRKLVEVLRPVHERVKGEVR